MPDLETTPRYQVGDQVRLKLPSRWVGTVTEVHFARFGKDHLLYRVRVPLDPEPLWMELREDEVEKV